MNTICKVADLASRVSEQPLCLHHPAELSCLHMRLLWKGSQAHAGGDGLDAAAMSTLDREVYNSSKEIMHVHRRINWCTQARPQRRLVHIRTAASL